MEHIAKKKLANGVVLTCYDLSKKVAGDRWLVKMRCDAFCLLEGWMDEEIATVSDPERLFLRERFADGLIYELVFERNFVDEAAKDLVLTDFVDRLNGKMAQYFSVAGFVPKLFAKRLAEFKKEFMCQAPIVAKDNDSEEEGDADFSACFK